MERGEAINYRKLIVSLQDVNNSERFPLSLASSVVTLGSGGGRINPLTERGRWRALGPTVYTT